MKFLRRFFSKPAVRRLNDPVIGPLAFENGLWSFVPPPEADGVMINVFAGDEGPAPEHRVVFQRVQAEMEDLLRRARRYLETLGMDHATAARHSLYAIEIGSQQEAAEGRFVLELSDIDANQIHRVSFRNGEPDGYEMDE